MEDLSKNLTQLFQRTIRFSFFMIGVGFFLGIITREFSRMLMKHFDYQTLLALQTNIMLSHGHAILIGAFLPLVLLFVTWLVRNSLTIQDLRKLNVATVHVFAGAVFSLALIVYKKIAFIFILSSSPRANWSEIDAALFGGSSAIRIVAHTLAHPVLAVGVIWWMLILWQRIKKSQTF